MCKLKCCILFLLCCMELFSFPGNRQMISEMDRLIACRREFEEQKNDRINYLKQLLGAEKNPDKQYDLIYRIVDEYANFQSDSAFVYIKKGKDLAIFNKSNSQLLENRFQYIFVCAQSGLMTESLSVLERLQEYYGWMSSEQKATYYILYERLYMNLREYSENSPMEEIYTGLEKAYNDSILVYLDESAPLYYYHTGKKLYMEGQYEEAFAPVYHYLEQIDTLSNDAARAYYQLSLLYKQKGDGESEEKSLIRSVIADEHSAVRQNRSLRLLAQLRYQQGDVKTAYRYIQVSSVDANFYNTKLRNSQIAEAWPIIERDYQLERDWQEWRLRIGFLLISILFVIILVFALYIRRKRRQLAVARGELMAQNRDLNRMNEEMKEKNEVLNRLADELQESDQIKEKYVGYFLQLCSVYIQRIGEYRKTVNRKIRTGQIDDLYRMTASTQALQNETKEFYKKFDEAFLHIFPNFVDDFNALLKEDQRFDLKKGELLNTELRIFALIRLGIKDSSQIAEFLSYNPVTIYSYRTKVKSKAISKGSFDKDIMEIRRKV